MIDRGSRGVAIDGGGGYKNTATGAVPDAVTDSFHVVALTAAGTATAKKITIYGWSTTAGVRRLEY